MSRAPLPDESVRARRADIRHEDIPHEGVLDAAGVPIRYVRQGRGEPVILVHCYTGDFESQWVQSGFFAALARSHHVVGLDLRGHGRSGKPHDPRCYGAKMAWDLVRLQDHLGLRRAHFVGYSMGAHIVAQLLTLAPQRMATAVLGGATGRRNWTTSDDERVAREAAEMEAGSLRAQIVRLWPPGQPGPTEAQIRERSQRYLAGKDPRALAAVRRANREQVITDAQMAAVTVPVLGIVGALDPYLAQFRQLATVMPHLELVLVEGAGHGDAAARPEFLRAVQRFLAVHAAARAA